MEKRQPSKNVVRAATKETLERSRGRETLPITDAQQNELLAKMDDDGDSVDAGEEVDIEIVADDDPTSAAEPGATIRSDEPER